MGAARLTAPNGAAVTVDSSTVDNFLRHGFQRVEEKPKATAKKSSSSKSSK